MPLADHGDPTATPIRRRLPPPGRLLEIAAGDQRLVATESGATLRVYDVGGRPVVAAFDGPDSPVTGCQGEVLAPWPNRVVDGRWTWRSAPHQLSVTEPQRGHALHGLVRTLTWEVVQHHDDRVALEVLLLAQPGWPFPLHCRVSYELGASGLVSSLTTTNVGCEPCPYGAATHPYVALAGGTVDDTIVDMRAGTWLETDDRLAPVGRRPAAETPYDFTDGSPVGARRIDNAFTDLERLPDGRVEASVTAPDGCTTTMWGDASVCWWQLFTGDSLPERWRRTTLALEPMTCGPDAFNSGDDLVVLEPDQSHTMTWGLTLR